MKKNYSRQMSKGKLLKTVLIRYISAIIIVSVVLFIPAGTIRFWNAWLYIACLFIPMVFTGIYLFVKDPSLLEKRMKSREKEKEQKLYVILSILVFFITFVMPGLDYRFKWSAVPVGIVIIACGFMLLGYVLFVMVMIQNSYASRVVEVQKGQKVIDTGLYSIVRHPMYLASIILFLATPIVLGSCYSLIPMVFYPIMLIFRIINEEKVLKAGLKGYEEYTKKVKYRLLPFIW